LRDEVKSAKNNAAREVGVKTKNFNIFCQSKDVWIPAKYLDNSFEKINIDDFKDEDCYMGVDLSASSDMTATAVLFPPNPDRDKYSDKYVFKFWIYIPEDTFEDSINSEQYKLWKR
jgi:phage terminase large subunit-like protein